LTGGKGGENSCGYGKGEECKAQKWVLWGGLHGTVGGGGWGPKGGAPRKKKNKKQLGLVSREGKINSGKAVAKQSILGGASSSKLGGERCKHETFSTWQNGGYWGRKGGKKL